VDEVTEHEAIDEQPASPLLGGYRRGRVRSMIESLERSGSSASGSEHVISPTEDLGPEQDDEIKAELKAAGLWFDEVEDDDSKEASRATRFRQALQLVKEKKWRRCYVRINRLQMV
jgi:hypothetical protein